MRAFSDPYFTIYGQYEQNPRPENTDQRKPIFWHILHSEHLNVKYIFHIMSQD